MKWDSLSNLTLSVMRNMGGFGPTSKPEDRQVKGYTIGPDGEGGKSYYDSGELREIAAACNEAADWLDKRAAIARATGESP